MDFLQIGQTLGFKQKIVLDYKNLFGMGHNSIFLIQYPNSKFCLKISSSLTEFVSNIGSKMNNNEFLVENGNFTSFRNLDVENSILSEQAQLHEDKLKGLIITSECQLEMLSSYIVQKPEKCRYMFVIKIVVKATKHLLKPYALYRLQLKIKDKIWKKDHFVLKESVLVRDLPIPSD